MNQNLLAEQQLEPEVSRYWDVMPSPSDRTRLVSSLCAKFHKTSNLSFHTAVTLFRSSDAHNNNTKFILFNSSPKKLKQQQMDGEHQLKPCSGF